MAINPVNGQNATLTALEGVNRAQEQFNKAAVDVVNSFTEATNEVSTGDFASVTVDANVIEAVSNEDTSVESALVGLIQAEQAVKANLAVMEVDQQMKDEVIDVVGKKRVLDVKA